MWNKLRVTAMVASLLAGTAALAYAQSSSTIGAGGSAAGTGKSGANTSSTLGTGGSTAGRERSGSSSTLGTAGSSAGSSTGVRERNQHRFKHGRHMGSTMGNRNAPGLR